MEQLKNFRIALIALWMAFMLPLAVGAKDARKVERGMTKAQVTEIYGKPKATSFDENGEYWSYEKTRGGMLTPYNVRITVEFDVEGKVVKCKEVITEEETKPANTTNTYNVGMGRYNGNGGRRHAMSDSDFNILLSKVKSASFNDRRLDLIQVACLGCWLTCRQGASLVGVFTFTDGKMNALKFVAPRLVDLQNANEIYRQFTFSSDKDKAAQIISQSQR